MLDLFFLVSSIIGQFNTVQPISTRSPLTNLLTLSRTRSTTTVPSSTFSTSNTIVPTTTTTFLLTTQPSDDDQVTRDAIIIGSIWGLIALIVLYICCKKKGSELEPIEPANLEYVKEKSYSSHTYAEIDNHPYEMPVIREDEIYGAQVTAL